MAKAGLMAILTAGTVLVHGVKADEPTKEQIQFFENKIRPVLADNCYKCHSHEATKLKGGLSVEFRDLLLKGGENGPAIVPGDPEKSLLIKAVRYTDPDLQMPPKDKKLSDQQISDLEAWVKMGAPDPRVMSAVIAKTWNKSERDHWSFKPVDQTRRAGSQGNQLGEDAGGLVHRRQVGGKRDEAFADG